MSPKRIKQRWNDFERALERLREVLDEDPSLSSAILDGTIQRFEFTYELAWKLGGDVLEYRGIEANHPRAIIKELFKVEMILEEDLWIKMMEDRNKTSHIYDETQAKDIYDKIKRNYYRLLEEFKQKLLSVVAEIKEI